MWTLHLLRALGTVVKYSERSKFQRRDYIFGLNMEATWIEKLGGVWRRGYSGVSRVQKQVGHLGAHKKCNLI